MKKAVIYSRVSTTEQDYTSQTSDLKKKAESMGYEVTHIYEEKESGFVDERPELAKVLSLTKAETDAVFVWEISRLSRRTVMVLSTIEEIEKKGILIFALNENYRSWNDKGVKDSTSKLVLTLYASIAEAEALKFKERVKRGKRYSVLVGKKAYGQKAPLGYLINEEGKLVINEEEAPMIRDIFQKAIEGYSLLRIREYLQSQYNHKTTGTAVHYILNNTAYMGVKPIGVRKGLSPKQKQKIESGTSIKFFNPETDIAETPAIVTPEIFEAAKRSMLGRKARSTAKDTKKNPPLLKGLIVCPRCGRGYTCTGVLYACCSSSLGVKAGCKNTSISPAAIEAVVWSVTKQVFSEAMAKDLAAKKAEPITAEIMLLQQEIDGYKESIAAAKKQIGKLINLATLADEVSEELLEKINTVKKSQKIAEAEVADRTARIELLQKRLDSPDEITEITDEAEKFDYLHKVIEAILIYGERSHKIVAIQYLNGITVYCIKPTTFADWYWFLDKGDLVVEDSVRLQQNSPKDLKLPDSILIEVTDENSSYYSGEETDKPIFGIYTTEAFFAAMMNNKQLNLVDYKPERKQWGGSRKRKK